MALTTAIRDAVAASARHPSSQRPYTQMVDHSDGDLPMLQLTMAAQAQGWTVLDMKRDWEVIDPPERHQRDAGIAHLQQIQPVPCQASRAGVLLSWPAMACGS